jgi:hypothetical protein
MPKDLGFEKMKLNTTTPGFRILEDEMKDYNAQDIGFKEWGFGFGV